MGQTETSGAPPLVMPLVIRRIDANHVVEKPAYLLCFVSTRHFQNFSLLYLFVYKAGQISSRAGGNLIRGAHLSDKLRLLVMEKLNVKFT